jgi:GNAT superfamily N-acetyltransferase
MTLRRLASSDAAALERFLESRRDSSMFLRSNAHRAGIEYGGQPFQAVYVAAVSDGAVTGVVAHSWNGMLILQAPDAPEAIATACVTESGRPVSGIVGPAEQVRAARTALGLAKAPTTTDSREVLYAVDLTHFVVPDPLVDRVRASRPPRADERDILCGWRLAYDLEALGAQDTDAQRRSSAAFLDAQIADGHVWVATEADMPVSLSAFNAALPDIVQVGGVYTPPPLRCRGHARVAVAASLLAAQARGVSRAVLFTANANAARAYEAVGFRPVGDYGVVLFRRPSPLARA